MISQGRLTQSLDIPLDKGPQIVEAKRGEPLQAVKPYTEEVRRDIDWELVDRGVDFIKRQKAAGKPFFLYLPISRTHFPNLPSKRFDGQSRIGQFGDSLMEADAIVGRMLDALQEVGLAQDTIALNGYPKIFNIGSDPREEHNIGAGRNCHMPREPTVA
jgi:arylsulfatase